MTLPQDLTTYTYDGHEFDYSRTGSPPAEMDLARRARLGDSDAATILDAKFVEIRTADGGFYWPMGGA